MDNPVQFAYNPVVDQSGHGSPADGTICKEIDSNEKSPDHEVRLTFNFAILYHREKWFSKNLCFRLLIFTMNSQQITLTPSPHQVVKNRNPPGKRE